MLNGLFFEDLRLMPNLLLTFLFFRRPPFLSQSAIASLADRLRNGDINRQGLEDKLGKDACWFFIYQENGLEKFPDWDTVNLPTSWKKKYEAVCAYLKEQPKDTAYYQAYVDKLDSTVREETETVLLDRKMNCAVTGGLLNKVGLPPTQTDSFLQIIQLVRCATRQKPKGLLPKVETYLDYFKDSLLKHRAVKFEIRQVEPKFVGTADQCKGYIMGVLPCMLSFQDIKLETSQVLDPISVQSALVVGQQIDAKVVEINHASGHVKLSMNLQKEDAKRYITENHILLKYGLSDQVTFKFVCSEDFHAEPINVEEIKKRANVKWLRSTKYPYFRNWEYFECRKEFDLHGSIEVRGT